MYYDIVESGKRIKEMRKNKGMTQEELAERLGMSREAIARIETGKNGTSVDGIISIAQVFDVSTDTVLGLEKNIELDREIATKFDMILDDKKQLAYDCIVSLLDNFIGQKNG